MSKTNIEILERAFSQFESMYNHYKTNLDNQDELGQEAIKESLVQRFEYTLELSWKILARYIYEDLGIEVMKAPKPILREAGKLEILDTEMWLKFVECRNRASHTYQQETLLDILFVMDDFYTHVKNLIEYLEVHTKDL